MSTTKAGEGREKATDKLDVKEFRERFCFPNGVSLELVNEEAAMPTEQGEDKAILFTKEQFNAGLRFPLPALFKEFLHFTQIPPIFIHPNIVRLPDSTKGGAKGLVLVRGGWAGLSERPSRPFSPNYTLEIPGPELRGVLVDWVEKASFACVCKLFEIDPKERACKTLLSARNLMAVVRESQEYVINILPRKMPKEVVPGEHYTLKELPIYMEAKEVDAENRRKLLEERDKKKSEGTIRKAPDETRVSSSKESASEKEKAGEEKWEGSEGYPSLDLALRKLPRGGCNNRGAGECCSSLCLKRPRAPRGVEPF
ncbi:hypothetical protein AAG906_009123 [Vitis piasezkii]